VLNGVLYPRHTKMESKKKCNDIVLLIIANLNKTLQRLSTSICQQPDDDKEIDDANLKLMEMK
jgi:hypothetical protein